MPDITPELQRSPWHGTTESGPLQVAGVLSVMWAIAIGPPAMVILVTAVTWVGIAFAVASLSTAVLPLAAAHAWARKTPRARIIIVAVASLWVVAMTTVLAVAPTGKPHGLRVSSHRLPLDRSSPRLSPSNLLPEEDQLMAGFTLAAAIDPLLTSGQAAALKHYTRDVYAELRRDPEFDALGSAMGYTYEALLVGRSQDEHCYAYVPSGLPITKPAPVLIFFHGSGGNFKGYLWVLSKVAERTGCIVVAPTGGAGGWSPLESEQGFENALRVAGQVAVVDKRQVHIAGLSNGGRAVSHLAQSHGAELASAVFISPVFDSTAVTSMMLANAWRGRRMLVISGTTDNRVPLSYVEEIVAEMRAPGIAVQLQRVDHADHFLIFSHRAELIDRLVDWLNTNAGTVN